MFNQKQVQEIINLTLDRLYTVDAYLLEKDASERSLVHQFTCHFNKIIDEQYPDCPYQVDVEYNLDQDEAKTLAINHTHTDITSYISEDQLQKLHDNGYISKLINPDFILHKRGGKETNILAIEFKKSSSPRNNQFDKFKLEKMKEDLKYKHASFIKLSVGQTYSRQRTQLEFI